MTPTPSNPAGVTVRYAEPVKCTLCKWRGRRTFHICDCDYGCSCNGFGRCPKCSAKVDSVANIRMAKENDRKVEAWLNSDEGRAAMAEVNRRFSPVPQPETPNG